VSAARGEIEQRAHQSWLGGGYLSGFAEVDWEQGERRADQNTY